MFTLVAAYDDEREPVVASGIAAILCHNLIEAAIFGLKTD
jgi:hypothetical protein